MLSTAIIKRINSIEQSIIEIEKSCITLIFINIPFDEIYLGTITV